VSELLALSDSPPRPASEPPIASVIPADSPPSALDSFTDHARHSERPPRDLFDDAHTSDPPPRDGFDDAQASDPPPRDGFDDPHTSDPPPRDGFDDAQASDPHPRGLFDDDDDAAADAPEPAKASSGREKPPSTKRLRHIFADSAPPPMHDDAGEARKGRVVSAPPDEEELDRALGDLLGDDFPKSVRAGSTSMESQLENLLESASPPEDEPQVDFGNLDDDIRQSAAAPDIGSHMFESVTPKSSRPPAPNRTGRTLAMRVPDAQAATTAPAASARLEQRATQPAPAEEDAFDDDEEEEDHGEGSRDEPYPSELSQRDDPSKQQKAAAGSQAPRDAFDEDYEDEEDEDYEDEEERDDRGRSDRSPPKLTERDTSPPASQAGWGEEPQQQSVAPRAIPAHERMLDRLNKISDRPLSRRPHPRPRAKPSLRADAWRCRADAGCG
jgi:hypothetical protein